MEEANVRFLELGVPEHFQRHKQLAGLDNPAKAGYTTIRELVENALDGCELLRNCRPEIEISAENMGPYYRIIVKDNGYGVPDEQIPKAFAKIFYGSKFENRQQRGTMGLGGKIVLMYGYLSTTKPYRIISALPNSKKIYVYDLGIDLHKNEPIIFKRFDVPNDKDWHGTVIRLYSKINLTRINKIKEYLKLTAMAMPYVGLTLTVDGKVVFRHVGNQNIPVPERAKTVKPHPHGIDTHDLQKLIAEYKERIRNEEKLTLENFLIHAFQNVGPLTAKKFLKHANLNGDMKIDELSHKDLMTLVDKLNDFDGFIAPSSDCLSILTEENIVAGLKEMYEPEFVTYVKRKGVYGGHAFIIELAAAIGGKIEPPKNEYCFNVIRFANKIPLLYDQYNCALYKNIMNINFKNYGIEPFEKLAFIVHMCSTKIPYKTEGKEYVSADYEEINKTILLAAQEALRKVKEYLNNKRRMVEQTQRMNRFLLYIPYIAKNLSALTGYKQNDLEHMFKKVLNIR